MARAVGIISLGNVLSRGLGLVREQVIAASFGLTGGNDAFVIARSVSGVLYDLLVGNVVTAAFVPVFIQERERGGPAQLWRVVGVVFSLAVVALALLAAVLALGAGPFVSVLASSFPEERQNLAADLLRITLVSVVLQGCAGVLMSALYAQERFTLPAFAVAIYNAGVILGVWLLASTLGIHAVAVGLVIGALGQLLLQAAGLRDFWRHYRPRIDLADPAVRRVLSLYLPVAAGMLITVLGYAIDRNLASRLAEGGPSAMQVATTVVQFPLGLVGIATSYAVLPTLSRFSSGASSDLRQYRDTLLFGARLVLLLMLPALAGLAVLAQPAIQLLFERGLFTAENTALTTTVFLAYLPQLPFTALDQLLIVAFYARQDVRTPVLVGVASVAVYLAVALSLLEPFGPVGLALADTAKNTAHALVLLALLTYRLPSLRPYAELGAFLGRVAPAAAVMGGITWAAWATALSSLPLLLGLSLAVVLGAGVYGALLLAFGVPEARRALRIGFYTST